MFNLNCPAGPVELRENYGFSHREVTQIRIMLTNYLAELCAAWANIHGNI